MLFIEEVCRTHATVGGSSYGQLVIKYGRMILRKLMFHNKNKSVPSNFSMKSSELENIDAGDMFELGVDFLDQMEATARMMKTVFDTFELGNKSFSLTLSGQCRLAALAPCTNDTSRLLELTTNLMRYLHLALPWDTLSGHRARFIEIHSALRRLYEEMSNLQYLRSLVQIPRLSEDISYFFDTLHKMSERSIEPEDHPNFEIQTFDQTDELVSTVDDSENASMAYIQQEYSDLSSRYQMVLQMLETEQNHRIRMEQDHAAKERQQREEIEALRKNFNECATTNNNESSSSAEVDGKLEKLKSAYQKLRTDHIALLRLKGDGDKKLIDITSKHDILNQMYLNLEAILREFFYRHHIEFNEVASAAEAFKLLDEKLSSLEVSLMAKDVALRALETNETSALTGLQESLSILTAENEKLGNIVKDSEELNKQLEANHNKLNMKYETLSKSWSDQVKWRLKSTEDFLLAEKSMSGGAPTEDALFGSCHLNTELFFSKEEAEATLAQDTAISLVESALMHLMPYANTDTVQLIRLYEIGSDFMADLRSNPDATKETWKNFQEEAIQQICAISSANFDPSDDVDKEIKDMQKAIAEAAEAMEKLMLAARANEAQKKDIEVDLKIIDSCCNLLTAVQTLIKDARQLQAEITDESGTFAKEFYQKNQKWSQGLISAAKDIGGGAKCLVDAADAVVSGRGKFEELMVASQEIAGSTAQMVLASKVKARKGSKKLEVLSTTSKTVGEATAQVIATCRACASQLAASENEVDLMALSVHQSKRLEMEVQIKVLELESQLEKQREKLFAIRKHQYAKPSGGGQETETDQQQ